jgi:5-methylcytosine-specific restriction endonuclease McrA
MNAAMRRLVRRRAGNRCEYCRMHQDDDPFLSFHVEHIIARQHRGGDRPSNLAWSCQKCNRAKGPNLAGRINDATVPM